MKSDVVGLHPVNSVAHIFITHPSWSISLLYPHCVSTKYGLLCGPLRNTYKRPTAYDYSYILHWFHGKVTSIFGKCLFFVNERLFGIWNENVHNGQINCILSLSLVFSIQTTYSFASVEVIVWRTLIDLCRGYGYFHRIQEGFISCIRNSWFISIIPALGKSGLNLWLSLYKKAKYLMIHFFEWFILTVAHWEKYWKTENVYNF